MAWYYVKRSCGHEERFQITGNHSYREWMIARLEKEPCADCVAVERAKENAAAAAANAESELPALVGSEKQIGWAETIRKGKLDQLGEIQKEFADQIAKEPDLFDATMRTIHGQNSASWWIDHRDMGLEYIIEEVGRKIRTGKVVPPTAPDVPVDAIAESTLRPENPKTETVAEIAIRENVIHITFPEKRETFRELMYGCGFRWNDGHWTRAIGKFAGMVEDRVAEVAAKAIAARYIVRVFDETIREKARNGTYAPEIRKWIVRDVDTDKFGIKWPKDGDFYGAARKLPGSRWDGGKHMVLVGSEHFEEVLDFAEVHGFAVSDGARDLAEQAKAIRDASLVCAPVKVKEPEETPKGRPVLETPVEVGIDDALRD